MLTIRLLLVACLGALVVPAFPGAASDPDGGPDPGFETLPPSAHPLMKGLRQAPTETRLWAQFSDSEGFFTTARGQLPGVHTPSDPTDGPQVVMSVFDTLDVVETAGRRLYHALPAAAAWDTSFDPDAAIRVSWQLSASARDLEEVHGVAPQLAVTTRLVAEHDHGMVVLATGKTTADILATDGKATRIDIALRPLGGTIRTGDRLTIELDWRWLDAPDGRPLVRPPIVSVHPGSWLDLPIVEPLRVLRFEERHVLEGLYVKAEVAHLFSARNIAIDDTLLAIHGPGANTVASHPLVRWVTDGEAVVHRVSFDWVVPFFSGSEAGEHRVWATVRQVSDPAPRLAASRTLWLGDEGAPAVDVSAQDTVVPTLLIVPAALVAVPFVYRRRP